ncbi:hypothetical protein [Streptosporangium carneum]|uniref:Uncharacterized protein n=1 Tax=Streptosporangium carneum TaxID=47481 RepID=A0A9W6MAT6_9ACTN|nr:hypothetical protein [Streptosporangium carneum]GLK07347.1 hypothetical protein GCM10017600_07520 [Streptosporangium carneum]
MTRPRTPPVDVGLLSEQLLALRQKHPGWHLSYDSGIRVWSALRSPFPDQREIDAGIRLLIKTPSSERMDEELTRQAELLKTLPDLPRSPAALRSFLRS